MTPHLYATYAEHYFDLEKRGEHLARDTSLLARRFRSEGVNRVLDLGCGTGEHVSALCELGLEVCGVDRSPEMIAIARRRFPVCDFFCADMEAGFSEEFENEEGFGGCYTLHGSFSYLLADEQIQVALTHMAAQLREGGIAVIETWHATPHLLIAQAEHSLPATEARVPGVPQLKRSRHVQLSSDSPPTMTVSYEFTDTDQGEVLREEHVLRLHTAEEMERLAESCGLHTSLVAGDLSGRMLGDTDGHLVMVLRKGDPD